MAYSQELSFTETEKTRRMFWYVLKKEKGRNHKNENPNGVNKLIA